MKSRISVLALLALAEATRRLTKTSDSREAIVRRLIGDYRPDLLSLLERGVQTVARTDVVEWAGAAIQQDMAEFFSAMPATSIYGALLQLATTQGVTMGSARTLVLPGRDPSVRLRYQWVAEGAAIPVSSGQLSGPILQKSKLACITYATDELLSSSAAADVLTMLLREDAAYAADAALLSADAGVPDVSPPGLLYNVVAVPPADPADPVVDVRNLLAALGNPTAPIFMANSAQMPGLASAHLLTTPTTLAGMPLIASPSVKPGQVIALDSASLALSIGDVVSIETSNQTVLHEEIDPTAIIDEAGAVAKPVRSTFQTCVTAFRSVLPTGWQTRRPDAVAHVDDVLW